MREILSPLRLVRHILLASAMLVAACATAGLIGGAIPANAGWRPPDRGVPIYVESNGVHVGFVLPKRAAGIDWSAAFPARDLADPRYAGHDHVAVGWGEKGFYLGTPTWADVKLSTILAALRGSDAVLVHVEHVPVPRTGDEVRRILLRPHEYRRLAAFIRASIAPRPRRYPGYAGYDVFYDARGRYDGVHDCNAWAGDALRHAGVRVGRWTPFPGTILSWF